MILPLQENQNDSAKYLILLGSRGQKPGKTGFGVELERATGHAGIDALRRWAAARNTLQVARRFVENISPEPMTVDVRLPLLKCAQNPNQQFRAIAFAIQKVP